MEYDNMVNYRIVARDAAHESDSVEVFLKPEAGTDYAEETVNFTLKKRDEHPEFKLKPEQFKGLMDFIKETRAEGKVKASYCCEDFVGEYEGEVRSNYSQGNIYEDDFMDVWCRLNDLA